MAVFGYSITEPRAETIAGTTFQIQWFERDRIGIQTDGSIASGRLAFS